VLINDILCLDESNSADQASIIRASIVVTTIESLPVKERVSLLIKDLNARGRLSQCEHSAYDELWFSLLANDYDKSELAAQLSLLGSGSCVFPYLNGLCGATKKERAMRAMLVDINRVYLTVSNDLLSIMDVNNLLLDVDGNFPGLVWAIYSYECSERMDDPVVSLIIDRISSLPSKRKVKLLLDDLDNRIWFNSESLLYPGIWYALVNDEVDRNELMRQLPNVNPDSHVFMFLNLLDEGDETPGEVNIRNVLLSADRLNPPKKVYCPFKKITHKLVELLKDFYGNFSALMDAYLYYSYTANYDIISSIYEKLDSLDPDERASLLVADIANRAIAPGLSSQLYRYNDFWYYMAEYDEEGKWLIDELVKLNPELSSGVFEYLRAASVDEDVDTDSALSLVRVLDAADSLIKANNDKVINQNN